jgi:hypothetical protein
VILWWCIDSEIIVAPFPPAENVCTAMQYVYNICSSNIALLHFWLVNTIKVQELLMNTVTAQLSSPDSFLRPSFWTQYNMLTRIVTEYISITIYHIFIHRFFPNVTYIQFPSRSWIGSEFPVLYIIFRNRNCVFENAIQYHISFCHFLWCPTHQQILDTQYSAT